jgi:glycine oxidase
VRPVDVVIVGAGVIGSAIAYVLSLSTDLNVVVVERGTPGCEASNAAAGVLAVASGQAGRGVLFELRRASAAMFPDWVAALEDETGAALGYRRSGLLSLALSDSQASDLQELVGHRIAQGLRCELLDRAAVLSTEPAVNPQVHAAALFFDDCCIDNVQLVRALVAACRRRGVQFLLGTAVRSLAGTHRGVKVTLQNDCIEAGVAVVAAGAWSSELLATCAVKAPVRPARGEMLAVKPTTWRLQHTLSAGDGYLVPRVGGEVLIGSTMAFAGYDKQVTAAGVAGLLAAAEHIVPGIGALPVMRSWAGLRPCSTIRRPIIARLPRVDNVILATGHHRNGILLAPITGKLVAEMITGAAPSVPLQPLSYRRH